MSESKKNELKRSLKIWIYQRRRISTSIQKIAVGDMMTKPNRPHRFHHEFWREDWSSEKETMVIILLYRLHNCRLHSTVYILNERVIMQKGCILVIHIHITSNNGVYMQVSLCDFKPKAPQIKSCHFSQQQQQPNPKPAAHQRASQ
jgi:hypothetical protein